jgi:hypothetical protein
MSRAPTITTPPLGSGIWLSRLIFLFFAVYAVMTIAFAVFLVQDAFRNSPTEFEKITISAVIVVLGTVVTALGAIYTANRQAGAAHQVAILNARLTADLDTMKAESSEALERLKAGLDLTKAAYRELFGAATTYFYTLHELATGSLWDNEPHKKANALMVEAARHLLYVSKDMRGMWLGFWTEADFIYGEAMKETDSTKRPNVLKAQFEEQFPADSSRQNLRKWHYDLEQKARAEAQAPLAT